MRKNTAVYLVALAWLGVVAPAARGDQKLYLVEYKFNEPKMYRMDLDGANLEEIVGLPAAEWLPLGIDIDETNNHIYWLNGNFNSGTIRRADVGLNVANSQLLLSGLTNARGLALDIAGRKMYWSDTQERVLRRANLDGGGNQVIVSTGDQYGRPTLDLVNGKVYFGNYGTGQIRRADLDGANNEPVITGVGHATGVALDLATGKIYWTDSSNVVNHIARANLDNTGMEVLIQFPPASSGLENIELDLAGGKMYWVDEITAVEKGVWRANLDGSDPVRIYESPSGWNAGAITLLLHGSCPGDLNGDGIVDLADLGILLADFGCVAPGPCPGDLDGDGDTDLADLGILLADFGCTS